MKNLNEYNVSELNNSELMNVNGDGIGVWFAQAWDSMEGAVYDLFNSQYQNAYNAALNNDC